MISDERIENGTHISEESFKCQLCLLSILVEFLLSAVFALLEFVELPTRFMKPMLYHFFDFSSEFSRGFVLGTVGFFGLLSASGWTAEPSQLLPSHFTIKTLSSTSSDGGAALSTSSREQPAEVLRTSDWTTSSPIFSLVPFSLFPASSLSLVWFFFLGSFSSYPSSSSLKKSATLIT